MDEKEARSLLTRHLQAWRGRSYQELVAAIGHAGCDEVIGPSGAAYQIEVDVSWDGKASGRVFVLAAIDDGHLVAAFCPLMDSFVMASDGSFVGEGAPNSATAEDGGEQAS